MAVKCNIAGLALERLNKLLWGISCKTSNNAIIENYIEYLACPEVILKPCFEGEPCVNTVTIHNCNLNITGITFNITDEAVDPDDLTTGQSLFLLSIGDIFGATAPIDYLWTVNTDHFEVVGTLDTPYLVVKPKPGKSLETITSLIRVDITDAQGCKDFKECYYTPTGMQCGNTFVPCSHTKDLVVTNNYVSCARPRYLQVTSN